MHFDVFTNILKFHYYVVYNTVNIDTGLCHCSNYKITIPFMSVGLTKWCGVVWCGVVWCGVVWCGVVWCGVVWCGVVWCGVVWCGILIFHRQYNVIRKKK